MASRFRESGAWPKMILRVISIEKNRDEVREGYEKSTFPVTP